MQECCQNYDCYEENIFYSKIEMLFHWHFYALLLLIQFSLQLQQNALSENKKTALDLAYAIGKHLFISAGVYLYKNFNKQKNLCRAALDIGQTLVMQRIASVDQTTTVVEQIFYCK